MPYRLVYHPKVAGEDLVGVPQNVRARLARAIEKRLSSAPEKYEHPLRGSLKGYWKLRVGDYRVVFKVVGREVWIGAIPAPQGMLRVADREAHPCLSGWLP